VKRRSSFVKRISYLVKRILSDASRFTVLLLCLSAGCSVATVNSRTIVPPFPPPKTPGSLWQEENGRAYLYEDLRAMRVGDIITDKIVENHKGSKSADTKAERESTIDSGLSTSTIGIPGLNLGSFMAGRAVPGLTVDASAKSKFGGKGATSRADTLTGTLSAMVTEVFPNGDLRIEGTREVKVNSEKQTMILSGVVRRVDVDTRNMVLSSAIADAKIEYTGLGVVDDVQRPGWLVRILDWIYPF
jgi:flagellar L-ring protein precursor FlgH